MAVGAAARTTGPPCAPPPADSVSGVEVTCGVCGASHQLGEQAAEDLAAGFWWECHAETGRATIVNPDGDEVDAGPIYCRARNHVEGTDPAPTPGGVTDGDGGTATDRGA